MIRHISIFFLKEEKKDANIKEMKAHLEELGRELTGAVAYTVGIHAGPRPAKGPGVPEFGDLIQIVDFKTKEDAAAYPLHPGHRKLMEETDAYIEKVVAMDVELDV